MKIAARKKRRHKKRHHPVRQHKPPKVVAPTPKPAPRPPVTTPKPPATTPAPAPDPTTWASPLPVATTRERLFLNRFGSGFTQASLTQLRALGTPEAWLAAQLQPASVAESRKVAEVDSWFTPLWQTALEKWNADQNGVKAAWTYGLDLGNWTLLRRMYSERSVLETMTDFWSSALHIPVGHDLAWAHRFDYDATIRQHALGRFEDLLLACSLHPAMRLYLDNWKSVKNAPNENQGRELLELHTVGRSAGYTEDMVKASARILSGYTVDFAWGKSFTFAGRYDATKHTTGPVQVLGFSDPNSDSDGQAVAVAYLKYLAHHPATARRLATKLATTFVSDSPSDGLVDHLAEVYSTNDTDISAVLTALSQHPDFLTSEGRKARTPYADLVATARALAIDVKKPTGSSSWANAANWLHGANELFSWPRPDGPPLTSAAWSSASRLFASYSMHQDLAGGWWPTQDATYRARAAWLPTSTLRFDAYVDHLCRLWLGRRADDRLLRAANQAVTGPQSWAVVTPSTLVTSQHALAGWLFPRLAMALLDTPDHMTS